MNDTKIQCRLCRRQIEKNETINIKYNENYDVPICKTHIIRVKK